MSIIRTTHRRDLSAIEGQALQMAIRDRPFYNSKNAPIGLAIIEEGGVTYVAIGRADDVIKIDMHLISKNKEPKGEPRTDGDD